MHGITILPSVSTPEQRIETITSPATICLNRAIRLEQAEQRREMQQALEAAR